MGDAVKWSVVQSDCIDWLSGLPDDHADLLFTSPPYMGARTYGIGFDMDAEEWAAWMLKVVRAAAPKVKGLMAIVCEGQTRDYAYQPAPFLLVADLYRAGFNLRKPAVFHRVGIPGSGGPDWLRNDWEPVVCVTRLGKLPWSDNTACGHPPKYAPGGEMSHRLTDGARVNKWGAGVNNVVGPRRADGTRNGNSGSPRLTKKMYSRNPDGERDKDEHYAPPALANPGNVIECVVGGGVMGSDLAHENEAPFPLDLASFFVKSFCPPGGLVIDPFSGSGTTGHAALDAGRRFAGCDVRESQVRLTERRLTSGITPDLFAGA